MRGLHGNGARFQCDEGIGSFMSIMESLAVEPWIDANTRLRGATPHEIITWAVEQFFPRLTMATAFGAEGCVLLHMLAEIEPRVRVFNLDTGYQFAETFELRDKIAERYGIEVEMIRPDTSVTEYESRHGGPLYVSNSDQCCYDRKIVPLRRAWWATTPGSRPSGLTSRRIAPAPRSRGETPNSTWSKSTRF